MACDDSILSMYDDWVYKSEEAKASCYLLNLFLVVSAGFRGSGLREIKL
jgi:hypothetical protein